jgi:hypothetical protein
MPQSDDITGPIKWTIHTRCYALLTIIGVGVSLFTNIMFKVVSSSDETNLIFWLLGNSVMAIACVMFCIVIFDVYHYFELHKEKI